MALHGHRAGNEGPAQGLPLPQMTPVSITQETWETPQNPAANNRTPAAGGKGRGGQKGGGSREKGSGKGGKGGKDGAKRVTFPWINGQIIAAADTEDLHHLLATVNAHLEQMNLVNLSTALHRVAKLSSGSANQARAQMMLQQTLPAMLAAIRQQLTRGEATGAIPKCQALSNITWALATLHVADVALLQMVVPRSQNRLEEFKNFELCQLLWAFAKLGTVDPALGDSSYPLFIAAAQFVIRNLSQFSFRGLVMTAWAFATAKQHDNKLFRAIAGGLIPQANAANCQELSNTAWAFSTAGVHEERLYAKLAAVAIPRVREFKPQELSSIMWSFASIGYNNDDFYEAMGRAAMHIELQAQQLANILWAITKMRPHHASTREVLLYLLPWCTALIHTFKTQELASVALAASKCFGSSPGSDEPHQPIPPQVAVFFHTVLPLAIPSLREYSGQSLANIAASFLAVQIGTTSGLFHSVSYEIMSRAESLENSALLLLLRTLPLAPHSAAVHSALCLLFAEAARRVDSLPLRELQVLARTCARPFGGSDAAAPPGSFAPTATWENREELRVWCLTLATKWRSGDMFAGQAGAAEQQATAVPGYTLPTAAAVAVDPDAEEDPDTAIARWGAPITLTIANTGRPASAWDEKAMQQMREQVEASQVRRDEENRVRGDEETHFVDGPAWSHQSPSKEEPRKVSQQPHFVFSVKNTFLDVEEDKKWGEEELDEELMSMPLPPALSFIPDSVSAEKLQAYRANYARFRVGNAIGAKGELDTTTM